MKKSVLVCVLGLMLCVPFFASSQVQLLMLEIGTDFPMPGEDVYFYIDSYILDLNTSLVKWTFNGAVVKEAVGARSITIKAGKAGSTNAVEVQVTTRDGRVIKEGIAFYPAEVTLLVETDGYLPPFYKGGSPYVMGGTVKLVALPEFFQGSTRMDPRNLVYSWKINQTIVPEASGYGKNVFLTDEVSYTRRAKEITVEVSAPSGIPSGRATAFIAPESPKLLVYEKNPTTGILFNKALTNQKDVIGNEITLFATPYYFSSVNNKLPATIGFDWLLGGFPADDYKNQRELVVVRRGGQTGTSKLFVTARDITDVLQSATNELNLVVK